MNLFNKQTATSINGITLKLTEAKRGECERGRLNPRDISPDDMGDVILSRMIKEEGKGRKGMWLN